MFSGKGSLIHEEDYYILYLFRAFPRCFVNTANYREQGFVFLSDSSTTICVHFLLQSPFSIGKKKKEKRSEGNIDKY